MNAHEFLESLRTGLYQLIDEIDEYDFAENVYVVEKKDLYEPLTEITLKDHIVPNWFSKEDIEDLMEKDITEDEFMRIKDLIDDIMPDWVSEEVREIIIDNYDEIFEDDEDGV